ncbi:hypothetical protein [Streptomyces sp. H27-C3]|uniref:hypothetical protein n=1 Tax=Streptomyces sp. H27-C3 TaxID=3046305 RepID=UPI0024B9751D|nr:hypothetical protein [Streptomyces sp. H27-C3]MDJ0464421.1 hypothetical protein [Streptomyces sp. H27-C3]
MNRRTLPAAIAFAATAALLLTACGGGDEEPEANDKIVGADTGDTKKKESPSTSAESAAGRPDLTLPKDIEESFESWKLGDEKRNAILVDAGHAQSAVTYAVAKGDPEAAPLTFYQQGDALVGSQDWVKSIVDSGKTFTGTVRYFSPDLTLFDEKSAALVYCADETKAFNKDRTTSKVEKSPASKDSYVLYSAHLEKSDGGVWQTTKLDSERGNQKCTS